MLSMILDFGFSVDVRTRFLSTYLEREMKFWKVCIVSCLQNISFEVNIGHFFNLEHLRLVYLLECVNTAMDVD